MGESRGKGLRRSEGMSSVFLWAEVSGKNETTREASKDNPGGEDLQASEDTCRRTEPFVLEALFAAPVIGPPRLSERGVGSSYPDRGSSSPWLVTITSYSERNRWQLERTPQPSLIFKSNLTCLYRFRRGKPSYS